MGKEPKWAMYGDKELFLGYWAAFNKVDNWVRENLVCALSWWVTFQAKKTLYTISLFTTYAITSVMNNHNISFPNSTGLYIGGKYWLATQIPSISNRDQTISHTKGPSRGHGVQDLQKWLIRANFLRKHALLGDLTEPFTVVVVVSVTTTKIWTPRYRQFDWASNSYRFIAGINTPQDLGEIWWAQPMWHDCSGELYHGNIFWLLCLRRSNSSSQLVLMFI